MAKLRPVSAEDRLTLVEHLGELRSRIVVGLAIFVVAFAFAFWQNHNVLDVINRPLENSQKLTKQCRTAKQSLNNAACFDKAVADALQRLGALSTAPGPAASPAQRQAARDAAAAVRKVQTIAPRTTTRKPVTLGVAEPFFQTLNVSMYAALVLSLPLLLYQLYAFLIPAFSRRERQVIVPLLVGVPFLFYGGVAFGYFLALPRAVDFLQNFNSESFDILVQAKDYYRFVALFLAGSGVIFQVPVVVLALSRLGILTARQLRKQRGIVAIIAAVVAALITPTPDAVTMLLMMAPLVVLFELSVLLAAYLEKRRPVVSRITGWGEDYDDEDDGGDDEPPVDDDFDPSDPDDGGEPPLPEEPDAGDVDGEQPDPELLGDPAGPRPVEDHPDPQDWLTQADDLDAEDPYADDPPR